MAKSVTTAMAALDINKADKNEQTPLHHACAAGDEKLVKELVQKGANLNAKDKDLHTALHFAAGAVHEKKYTAGLSIIKFLIDKGTNPNTKNKDGHTFLHFLMAMKGITPKQFHELVVHLNGKKLIKLFNIALGNGLTPMINAVRHIDIEDETLILLINGGANIHVVDANNSNLLGYAVDGKRSLGLVATLIALGVNWRGVDKNGAGLLHIAAASGNSDAILFLSNIGLAINVRDLGGSTPLHHAADCGKVKVADTVRLLIARGADISIKDHEGNTALALALNRKDLPDKDKVLLLLANVVK